MATNQLKSHRLDYLEKQMHELKIENKLLREDCNALQGEYKMLHAYKTHAEIVMRAMGSELDRISMQVFQNAPSKKYESHTVYKGIPTIKNASSPSDSESD